MPSSPTVRPNGYSFINRGHPLASRLAFYILPCLGLIRDIVTWASVSPGFTTINSTPYGPGAYINSPATSPSFARGTSLVKTSSSDGLGDFSVGVIANTPSQSAQAILVSQRYANGTTLPQFALTSNVVLPSGTITPGALLFSLYNNGADYYACTDSGACDGNYHVIVASRVNSVHRIFVDGIDRTTVQNNGIVNILDANQILRFGGQADDAGATGVDANCNNVLWCAWNRGLAPQEVALFAHDPWFALRSDIFESKMRLIGASAQFILPFLKQNHQTYLRR